MFSSKLSALTVLWLIPVATTMGGLISGFLVYTFVPEAEGHGTDTVVKAFHSDRGIHLVSGLLR